MRTTTFCTVSGNDKKNLGPIPDDFLKHYASFQLISYLRACQQLNILDALPDQESNNLLSIEEISEQCNAKNPQNVYRTLRFLSFFGYTKQIQNVNGDSHYFVHTDLSKQYAKNPITKQPYNPWIYFGFATMSAAVNIQCYSSINEWILNNETPFEHTHGVPLFGEKTDFVQQKKNQQWTAGMFSWFQNLGMRSMNDIANNFDFGSFNIICDVGGGMGQMCAPILKKYKNMQKAIIFDTQNIIQQAKQQKNEIFDSKDVSKVEYVVGNFLKTIDVDRTADIYLLRWILHDWNDELCHQIISTVRKLMDNNKTVKKEAKRLLIVEFLIKGVDEEFDADNMLDLNALHYDMLMALLFNAKERTVLAGI